MLSECWLCKLREETAGSKKQRVPENDCKKEPVCAVGAVPVFAGRGRNCDLT